MHFLLDFANTTNTPEMLNNIVNKQYRCKNGFHKTTRKEIKDES